MDVVGAGIYAFLNRLLIPTGLHHALNNVFWFDTIGLGDLQHFWAGETSADVSWSLGMYMSGFFPCMMFGIPGAALAMVKCAKPAKKKVAIGLVASAAICAFICGVTEPFEFGFMFLAPGLYVIYALLYGIFTMITVALGFRAGFSFSAGAMDLLFSSSLPAAQEPTLRASWRRALPAAGRQTARQTPKGRAPPPGAMFSSRGRPSLQFAARGCTIGIFRAACPNIRGGRRCYERGTP